MRGAVIGLVSLLSIACFDGGLTGSSTVTGTYTLRRINDSPLPYTVTGTGMGTTEIVDGSVTLHITTTYTRLGHSRTTLNGQVTDEYTTETGNWFPEGTRVSLRSAAGGAATETVISGNSMTIVNPGMTLVFSK